MLDLNPVQNEIINARNRRIEALEERLQEEKEYLAAYIRTIPIATAVGGERK